MTRKKIKKAKFLCKKIDDKKKTKTKHNWHASMFEKANTKYCKIRRGEFLRNNLRMKRKMKLRSQNEIVKEKKMDI